MKAETECDAEKHPVPGHGQHTPSQHGGDEVELSLLQEALNFSDSTLFRWHIHSGALEWTSNAATVLHLDPDTPPPASIDAWIARMSTEDQTRFLMVRDAISTHMRDIDVEYTIIPHDGAAPLRIRHNGKIVRDDKGHPVTVFSTLWASLLEPQKYLPEVAYLPHTLPDRRASDRRGYQYPPVFTKHLHETIEYCKGHDRQGTFMLLEINNLAMIVNGYGFEVSERIIMEIMQCIRQCLVTPYDRVERIHRDQLGIILTDCNRVKAEMQAAEFRSAVQNLSSRTNIGPVHVTCSMGSVGFPFPADTVKEALDKAYIALNDDNTIIYRAYEDTSNDSKKSREQMALANYLHDAIKEDRLRLAFQPIITAATGETAHYESLLRVVGTDGVISSAGALIPIAERMGLIEIIDRLVVKKVVEELQAHPTVSLAFNISSVTTGNPEWVRYLAKLIDNDLSLASRMVVEITETAAQRDLRETAYFVASVQALGCLVALDDFGSGYTSFRQLKALSVDILKIDGAFVRDLVDNADNRFFVKTLLDFTSGYGLKAVAEYVETGEIAKMLMDLGVEYMQGYYFGQPYNYRPWLNEGEYTPS